MKAGSGFFLLLSFLSTLTVSYGVHGIVGTPPQITSQQEDVTVFSGVNQVDGIAADLVLFCQASGMPPPTIAWFMDGSQVSSEFVDSNGTLVMNVTEGSGASRTGVSYHCTATNSVGPEGSVTAIARSRDIVVTYSFFEGFQRGMLNTQQLQTVVGGSVAMECDYLAASPRPEVQWFMNNDTLVGNQTEGDDVILLIEGGRYLFIRQLTSAQRNAAYHCEVSNAFLGTMPQRSPTTYTLLGEIPDLTALEVYLGNQSLTAILNSNGETEPVEVVYAAAHRRGTGASNVILGRCEPGSVNAAPGTVRGITTFTQLQTAVVNDNRQVDVSCEVSGTTLNPVPMVTFSFLLSQPATITAPGIDDRERLVGGGQVRYVCASAGMPAPSVRWFYNGDSIPPDMGISVNGNELVIAEPQVRNSGIYQCMVSNTIDGIAREDMTQWVLEVREPVAPTVSPLFMTNTDAEPDRLEGTVIVRDPSTTDVIITAVVASDPCPSVEWMFGGMVASSPDFTANNPCDETDPMSPYNFTLTIANLTMATSGKYTAVFSHLGGMASLPGLFVTVPVFVELVSLDLFSDNSEVQCLLQGSTITLTCVSTGFPRPEIIFTKNSEEIDLTMERFNRLSPDQITISNVEMSDAGSYTCTSQDARVGPPVRSLVFCTFPAVNRTSESPTRQEMPVIPVGGELELSCAFSGEPTPTVIWTHEGVEITPAIADVRNIDIAISIDGVATLRLESATSEDNGIYRCIANNLAGNVSSVFSVDRIMVVNEPILSTAAIIGIAAGGVGFFLLVVLLILLLVCVYLCAKRGKSDSADFAYNVDYSQGKPQDFSDGRGNVDTDSYDGAQPEAFDPDYDSVPTRRPNEPPPYKVAPSYQHGAPLDGDDMEMVKYPPPDSESFVAGGVPPYSRSGHDNGYRQPPSADDFLSEDAQFV